MAAKNDITGDAIATGVASDTFRNNYDAIFRKPPIAAEKKWLIAKNATDSMWQHYWQTNPADGIIASHSAFFTPTGKTVGIDPTYVSLTKALVDCEKMNHNNPSGNYAVVPVIGENDA